MRAAWLWMLTVLITAAIIFAFPSAPEAPLRDSFKPEPTATAEPLVLSVKGKATFFDAERDGQYFRLNKITDYPVGGAEVVECEFLKLKTGNQFTPQTGRTGSGYDVKDEFNNRWPDLRNGFDKPARNFSYFDIGGGNSGNYKPIFDVVQGLDDIYKNQFDPPSTGDKYRPTIEWSGTNWDIVLIEEI